MKVRLVWLAFNRLPHDSRIPAASARFALVFEIPRRHDHRSEFKNNRHVSGVPALNAKVTKTILYSESDNYRDQ